MKVRRSRHCLEGKHWMKFQSEIAYNVLHFEVEMSMSYLNQKVPWLKMEFFNVNQRPQKMEKSFPRLNSAIKQFEGRGKKSAKKLSVNPKQKLISSIHNLYHLIAKPNCIITLENVVTKVV